MRFPTALLDDIAQLATCTEKRILVWPTFLTSGTWQLLRLLDMAVRLARGGRRLVVVTAAAAEPVADLAVVTQHDSLPADAVLVAWMVPAVPPEFAGIVLCMGPHIPYSVLRGAPTWALSIPSLLNMAVDVDVVDQFNAMGDCLFCTPSGMCVVEEEYLAAIVHNLNGHPLVVLTNNKADHWTVSNYFNNHTHVARSVRVCMQALPDDMRDDVVVLWRAAAPVPQALDSSGAWVVAFTIGGTLAQQAVLGLDSPSCCVNALECYFDIAESL